MGTSPSTPEPSSVDTAEAGSTTASLPRPVETIVAELTRNSGKLSTTALAHMERTVGWFAALPAEERSWVGLILQAGVKSFIDWYRHPKSSVPLRNEIFGVAPETMAGKISLQQTVALVRIAVDVVDANLEEVLPSADVEPAREALNRYAREVAFATAEVYARAAEQRGAWDARLEALVVDSVMRNDDHETITSRASALGWGANSFVTAIVGNLGSDGQALETVRRTARECRFDCICAVHGDRLVAILGSNSSETVSLLESVAASFAPGPVVVGPTVADIAEVATSAAAALSGWRVAHGWREAPRPVAADALLPERLLAGDDQAYSVLAHQLYPMVAQLGESVLDTLATYLEVGRSLEATARKLFIHPNTVRYRLRGVTEAVGLSPTDPRDGFTLQVMLTVGRLNHHSL